MSVYDESHALMFDPFEGDFDGSGQSDGILSDQIVTARKGGECHACAGQIIIGTRVRRRTEVYDGEFMRFNWCAECCSTMAVGINDPNAYERRLEIGMKARLSVADQAEGGAE